MDVLKFLSSRDMREHLKKINYKFSALEAAWIVWHSDFTWGEKKKAFLEIMSEFEDMYIDRTAGCFTSKGNLFDYIKKHINWFEKQISLLRKNENNCIYNYKIKYDCGREDWCDWNHYYYSTYEKCLADLKKELVKVDEKDAIVVMKKEYLDESKCPIESKFDKLLNVLDVDGGQDENENIGHIFFESFWLDLPHPFKKGDILYNNSKCYPYRNKVVAHYINDIPENFKKNADFSDMNVVGYGVCDDGTVEWDHYFFYMDWEKWEGESNGKDDALLKVISMFLKGDAPFDEVLDVQCEVLTRHMHEKMKSNIQWTEEFHKKIYGSKRNIKD